jgi:adenylosuccinate synthase
MSTLVVVGGQWGDEGKGKVVDFLAGEADLVARYGGGNNAGHTLVVRGQQIITHLVPSGCRYAGTTCVLGAGMVIDPDVLHEEIATLRGLGLLQNDELRVSLDAHIIFPYHRDLDGLREDRPSASSAKIGTTRRGIGPAYEAKVGRRGIRVRDLFDDERLRAKLEHNATIIDPEVERLGAPECRLDVDALIGLAGGWRQWLEPMLCDVSGLVRDAIRAGKKVLFEGAQGAMLDVDHGTYPFVTSSSTVAGGVCTGIGIGPTLIDRVWGISKAYTTRVGGGPLPTRLTGAEGDRLREAGAEYGATTGRPRDCGWLDLPALRRAAGVHGLTGLCVTKLDVLAALPEVRICTAYRDGVEPGRDGFEGARPELRLLPGWGDGNLLDQVRKARKLADLPAPARAYLDLVAQEVEIPVALVSVGAERDQTIVLADAF